MPPHSDKTHQLAELRLVPLKEAAATKEDYEAAFIANDEALAEAIRGSWTIKSVTAIRLAKHKPRNPKRLEVRVEWQEITVTNTEALENTWSKCKAEPLGYGFVRLSWEPQWLSLSCLNQPISTLRAAENLLQRTEKERFTVQKMKREWKINGKKELGWKAARSRLHRYQKALEISMKHFNRESAQEQLKRSKVVIID